MEESKQKNILKKVLIVIIFLSTYLMVFLLGRITNKLTLGESDFSDTSTPSVNENEPDNTTQNSQETDNTTQDSQEPDNTIQDPQEPDRIITLLEGDKDWNKIEELSIFKNTFYNKEASNVIAPGFYGTYEFAIENKGEEDINYILSFKEENPQKVNMVYKLSSESEYILGNNTQNVYLDNVKLEEVTIPAKSRIMYKLEWKWEDAENDTKIGELGNVQYKLQVSLQT